MKGKTKEIKGITLIALVVTIIVLLILAGIAINLTIGNNGLFSRAQGAANIWDEASKNEIDEMNKFIKVYDDIMKNEHLDEGREVEFYIDETPYTVPRGATWMDFFSENFPNNYDYIYRVGADEVNGLVGRIISESNSGATAYYGYLIDEMNSKQGVGAPIEALRYHFASAIGNGGSFVVYSPADFALF